MKNIQNGYFYNQLFLLLLPPLYTGVLFSRDVWDKKSLLRSENFICAILILPGLFHIIVNLDKFIFQSFNILYSKSPFESGLSHLMGLVFVFAIVRKKSWLILPSILLLFLLSKRIAILSSIIILTTLVVVRTFPKKIRWSITICCIFLMNLSFICVVYDIVYGDILDSLTRFYFGISLDAFAMGRLGIYSNLSALANYKSLLFGNGIGHVNLYLRNFPQYEGLGYNPHSDVLRLMLEFGILLFITWFYFLYQSFTALKNYRYLFFPLYINMLMLTDNVILYHYVTVPFFTLSFISFKIQLLESED
ncbi:MAG: O-antigen ligase family protein [Bacteroidota bacterium]